jgi:hypothetical protein
MIRSAAQYDPSLVQGVHPPLRAAREFDTPVVLLAILGCLLLLVGLLSSWGIKRIDKDYSKLISQTALDLDRLHDISYHAGIGCATALELTSTDDPAKRATMLRAIADERRANNQVFAELLNKASDPRSRSGFDEVLVKRALFTHTADAFLRSLTDPSAEPHLSSVPLLEAFIQYQKSCDSVADLIRARSLQASSQLTKDASKFRILFFATGALPILLGLAGILLTFYFVLLTPHEADFKE